MKNGVNKKRYVEHLPPYASQYEYVGGPVTAEGIFAGKQTSPWIRVKRPSDWYRGPWQIDRTQRNEFRRQPRPLALVDRGAGYRVPPGTGVSGCAMCGLGAESVPPVVTEIDRHIKTTAVLVGAVVLTWWLLKYHELL